MTRGSTSLIARGGPAEHASHPGHPGHPGLIARAVELVVDPRAALRAIVERPAWLGAFAIVVALRFGSLFVFYDPQVTPAKLAVGLAFQVGTLAPMLIATSALVWASGRAWGARISWKTALSVVAHVQVVYTLATIALAGVAGAVLPASADIDLQNPPFANLSALIDPSHSPVLHRLLGEMDVRSGYALALVALGMRAAAPEAGRWRVAGVIGSCFLIRLVLTAWSAFR